MNSSPARPHWEVADILRRFGESYRSSHGVTSSQLRIMRHIEQCRTAALGGHMEECDSCGHLRPVYNSCRDRHCPKCQTMTKELWLSERKADLLPVDYFHQVFTLPHEFNPLVLFNKKIMIHLLFQAVSETLLAFGHGPKSHLNGLVGFTLVLHTWNQQLLDHFHLHSVIPAGALSLDGKSWIPGRHKNYLFSVKALSVVFRAKFLELFKNANQDNKIVFPNQLDYLQKPRCFDDFILSLTSKKWVVYSKAPFGGPEGVLEYLGRYTHRVAISNHRIIDITDEDVTFSYRDREQNNQKRVATIPAEEFIRRFLLHTLPSGLMRIRHYGFLASRKKKQSLELIRTALNAGKPPAVKIKTLPLAERILLLVGIDIKQCPCCKIGKMHTVSLPLPKSAGIMTGNSINFINTS